MVQKKEHNEDGAPDIVIITGLSGSGMSSAVNAFEDLGYFCVDNLPITLLPTFARLVQKGEDEGASIERAALVVDIREGRFLSEFEPKLREHLEIRGLGIINIRDLFGVSALSQMKNIDLSIRLERWEEASEIDRLGIDTRSILILGVEVPQFLLPVSPGRNLSTLVETAVRIQLLRSRGYNAAEEFVARHTEILESKQ